MSAQTAIYKATVTVYVSGDAADLTFAQNYAVERLRSEADDLSVDDLEQVVSPSVFKEIVTTALLVANEGLSYPHVQIVTEAKLLMKYKQEIIPHETLEHIWGHVETLVERIQEGEIALADV